MDRNPHDELANRAASAGAGLQAAARGIGVFSHWDMLDSTQDRVDDAHDWGAQALGLKTGRMQQRESNQAGTEDDMSKRLDVSGDHHHHYKPVPVPGPTGLNGWHLLGAAAVAAATWLGSKWLDKPAAPEPQVITQPGEVWESDVEMIVE